MRAPLWLWGCFVLATALGCNLLLGNDLDDALPITADATTYDAAEGGLDMDATNAPCPGSAGPASERIVFNGASFCIDKTEVTVRDYRAFLQSLPDGGAVAEGGPSHPGCAWKTTFVPSSLPNNLELPVAEVDWCDAWTFCAWAGKRLCGALGGQRVLLSSDEPDANLSEWSRACGGPDARLYPYGDQLDIDGCQSGLADGGKSTIAVVGAHRSCEGGYAGLFDMVGNVSEWEDACQDKIIGASDACLTRGGGKNDLPKELTCPNHEQRLRSSRNSDVGFRCCSD